MHRRLFAILLAGTAVVAGCSRVDSGATPARGQPTEPPASVTQSAQTAAASVSPAESPLRYPGGCTDFDLSAHRCEAIVDALAAGLNVRPTETTSIDLLGDPGCGFQCVRTSAFVVRVRFHMPDGSAPEDSMICGAGSPRSILCSETPEIQVTADLYRNGYHDIPCAGEPPTGCASPVPTIDPAVAADARPLLIKAMDIPLDRVGAYSVELGNAVLANGILSDASFTLADVHPTRWWTTDVGVRLVVESLDGGPAFSNIYEHGWRPGVERVVAKAVFEITKADPGAVMQIRNVVIR